MNGPAFEEVESQHPPELAVGLLELRLDPLAVLVGDRRLRLGEAGHRLDRRQLGQRPHEAVEEEVAGAAAEVEFGPVIAIE